MDRRSFLLTGASAAAVALLARGAVAAHPAVRSTYVVRADRQWMAGSKRVCGGVRGPLRFAGVDRAALLRLS